MMGVLLIDCCLVLDGFGMFWCGLLMFLVGCHKDPAAVFAAFPLGFSSAQLCYRWCRCSAGTEVMMKGHPCRIVEVSISQTGKHGHAKVHMLGLETWSLLRGLACY